MKIVVIIPTYNEIENIGKILDVLLNEEFPKIKNHDMHILVVDSKSPDGTGQVVKEKMKSHENLELLETKKEGLGADYVKAMKYAMNEMKAFAIVEFDADFQHDPKDIKKLINEMDKGADYVIGSRYIPGGKIPPEWGIHRKFLSFFGSLFARVVFFMPQIHDMTSGMKLTRTEYLKQVDLDNLLSKYYAYKLHILHDLVHLGATTAEAPIIFHERKEGSSKISQKDLIDSFIVVIKLRIRDSKKFIKFATVGFIGFVINVIGLELFFRLGMSPGVAAAIGAEFAIVSNFTLNNIWTFKEEKITKAGALVNKFLQFNLASAGAIVIQAIIVWIGTSMLGDQFRLLMLVIAVGFFVMPYNYVVYNVFIWKNWKLPGALGKLQKN